MNFQELAPYRKFAVAVVGAVISWLGVVILSEPARISAAEWYLLVSTIGTALGVYQIKNDKA